ncbi:MAG: sortase [Patescibacteria group bacterium]
MKNIFTEEDLKVLFTQDSSLFKPVKFVRIRDYFASLKKYNLRFYSIFCIIFVIIFLISYTLINFPALSKQFQYFWQTGVAKKNYSEPSPTINLFSPSSSARLIIPTISVNAPIVWNVSEDQIDDNLLKGVVHSLGTALPGQDGNIFITGHSSYYPWVQSDYKFVFTLLDRIKINDDILIEYKDIVFQYRVENIKVINPKDLSVMDYKAGKNLTLMTCVPVGTNLNRLIIQASQISTSE